MDTQQKILEVGDGHMPALGFGTWQVEGKECVESVADALLVGYRHVDTAEAYENEREVGAGVRRSGVDREKVWITTKVWWEHLSRDECIASAEASLDRLDLGWIDLLLIHWPAYDVPMDEPLAAFRELQARGVTRHIGVSNFTPAMVRRALDVAPVSCIQAEYHPWLAQDELIQIARDHDIAFTAYSPLGRGRVAQDETLREIAEHHGKSPAQVALRWLLQQPPVAAIPRASSPEHRRENFDIFDFVLADDEMERVAALAEGYRIIDPEFAPAWDR
ncbi:MAG: aldo/keto reductase [Gemmatimonadota bacterium]